MSDAIQGSVLHGTWDSRAEAILKKSPFYAWGKGKNEKRQVTRPASTLAFYTFELRVFFITIDPKDVHYWWTLSLERFISASLCYFKSSKVNVRKIKTIFCFFMTFCAFYITNGSKSGK